MSTLRSSIRAALVVFALTACAGAHAVEGSSSSSELQGLVGDARASLQRLREYLYAVEVDLVRNSSQTDMRGGRMMGASPSFRDLDRESENLTSVAAQISGVVAKCGKDGAKVGSEVKSAARRIKGSINRITSSNNFGTVQMATDKVRIDADSAERSFVAALQMQGCVHEGSPDGEDEAKKEDGEEKPKES